jgi:hypothetical protein
MRFETGVIVNGRRVRGRAFVPGLSEPMNTAAGNPLNTLVTLMISAGQGLITDPGNTLMVWSRTHSQAHEATAAGASSKWATLRSRRD